MRVGTEGGKAGSRGVGEERKRGMVGEGRRKAASGEGRAGGGVWLVKEWRDGRERLAGWLAMPHSPTSSLPSTPPSTTTSTAPQPRSQLISFLALSLLAFNVHPFAYHFI